MDAKLMFSMRAMSTLVSLTAAGVGRKYRVDTECLIGRHPDCDIQVVDAQLSKHHAKVVVDDGAAAVHDLGSLNGVFVNGERVTDPVALKPNDVISIGSQVFLFDPNLEVVPVDDGSQAVILVDGDETGQIRERALVPPESPSLTQALTAELFAVLTGELSAEASAPELMRHLERSVPYDAAALLVGQGDDIEALYVVSKRRTLSVPSSIVRLALEEGKAAVIPDALGDTYFRDGKSVVSQQLRSVLVAPLAVGVVRVGALFLTKDEPEAYDDAVLDRLLEAAPLMAVAVAQTRRLRQLGRRIAAPQGERYRILGDSEAIARVREAVAKAAKVDSSVLICGETGTGKELVARQLHLQGPRASAEFVAVNCGAIPQHLVESELFGHEKGAFSGADQQKLGQLELASGGTLFLDEVGELPLAAQVKLLRALQERTFYRLGGIKPVRVDFRVVAATHRDLERAMADGSFREDLFYRLNVLRIDVSSLRARRDDIPLLVEHFVASISGELGVRPGAVSPAALEALCLYPWPGNIRELRNAIERVLVLAEEGAPIERSDLPPELLGPPPAGTAAGTLPERVAHLEREMVVEALKAARGKKVDAARALGISRPTLDRKLSVYDIDIFGDDA